MEVEGADATTARILARCERSENGCWIWRGWHNDRGYGRVGVKGKNRLVHRAVYEALRGPIPDGLHLHHRCKNPLCVNPDHLEPVTRQEHARKHHPPGLGVCEHTPTPENTQIRKDGRGRRCLLCRSEERRREWERRQERGKKLRGLTEEQRRVAMRVLRERRERVPFNSGSRNPHAKLTEEKVREIRAMIERGGRPVEIARHFGCSPNVIYAIRSGERWTHVR